MNLSGISLSFFQELTEALLNHFQAKKVLGIDIDPQLVQTARDKFPHRRSQITFETCDITQNLNVIDTYLGQENILGFELISCFSVSMWIHLNKGEQGLVQLFQNVHKLCNNLFLLEPQPWKCYMTAARRMRKLKQPKFEHLDLIDQRQDQLLPYMSNLVESAGFELISKLGQTSWDRQILLFKKVVK